MSGITFGRPARSYPEPLPSEPVELAAPPTVPGATGGGGALMYLVPALASVASVGFIFTFPGAQRNRAMVLLVALIVVISVLSGVLMWWTQRRALVKRRRWERSRYLEYLERRQAELAALSGRQSEQLWALHPGTEALAALAGARERVWERRRSDGDFLQVALGRGRVPLCSRVVLQVSDNNPLIEYEPDLLDRAHAVAGRFRDLAGVPVDADLRAAGWLAIEGDPAAARDLVRAMLVEAGVLCGPDELQLTVLTDPDLLGEWEWVKWLPHCRRSRSARTGREQAAALLAAEPEAASALLADLLVPRLVRAAGTTRPAPQVMPHLLLVVDGAQPSGLVQRLPDFERLMAGAAAAGVTVLWLPGGGRAAAAGVRLEVAESGLLTYEEAAFGGRRVDGVRAERCAPAVAERVARALAPLRLEEKEAARDLGDTVRLVEMLGMRSVDEIEPAALWSADPTFGLLRIPIGERMDGNPVVLDLKEAAEGGMGPHGLVVGATGSGKSELLRTVVSALAATHDPDVLSFVFFDFKGGASFADLARLPHSAGMITNLGRDLTLVDRMQAALFGEQERRQRLLLEAGNLDNIRQYRARRRGDPTMQPLPYLLVIVDEFGELLANRPDFLDLFVTLGRVGRSIGMHLLLATQRLDEGRIRGLEGHLRYRVCLRTFSAEESASVLGSPDAYHLPSYPGTGYIKVDGPLDLFKVALVSTPVTAAGTDPIQHFTAAGRLQRTAANGPEEPAEVTEMDALIDRLEGTRAGVHQVWLPPLPPRLGLAELGAGAWRPDLRDGGPEKSAFGHLRVAVGKADLPRAQRQEPLVLDFSGIGGHLAVVGAPQSGKSTLLRSVLAAFALTHSPAVVQFYLADLGGGQLRALDGLPHVGAVAGQAERDRIVQVVHHAAAVIDEREALFREHGLDGMAAYRRARAGGRLPGARYGDVFLVVDDIAQAQADVEQVEPELVRIATAGLSYGVHLVLTANRWADIRPKVRDAIGSRLELRLNDPGDSEVGRQVALTLPPGIPGRGLTREGLHFQAALPAVDGVGVEGLVEWARQAWLPAPAAPPVLSLPPLVGADELPPGGLGLEASGLQPVVIDLAAGDPHFVVFGDAESGKTNLLRTWIRGLARTAAAADTEVYVVDYRRTLADLEGPRVAELVTSAPALNTLVSRLADELSRREPAGLGERWSGSHVYLFVDDYEWVVSAIGNPLAPLTELLLQGGDIGLHVVLARRVGGTTRSSFEPFFQRLREMGVPGVVLSGDPQEGPVLGAIRAQPMPPGRGLLVRRGHKPVLIQCAYTTLRPGLVRTDEASGA